MNDLTEIVAEIEKIEFFNKTIPQLNDEFVNILNKFNIRENTTNFLVLCKIFRGSVLDAIDKNLFEKIMTTYEQIEYVYL